ncbi:hypothetical protein D1094_14370 [Colwellia sp. RSH04]|nr:hypothetical protein D1094_14370 [Colwellia sp. RSH04]
MVTQGIYMRSTRYLLYPLTSLLFACSTSNEIDNSTKQNMSNSDVEFVQNAPLGTIQNPIKYQLGIPVRNINTNKPLYYTVEVPSEQSSLVFSLAWGKDSKVFGNPDIYVSHEQIPTVDNYDCRGTWKKGDSELCVFDKPKAGNYYLLINPVIDKSDKEHEKPGKYEVNDGLLYTSTEIYSINYSCKNALADIRAQALTEKQKSFVCQRLAMTQERFINDWTKIDPYFAQPIEGDLNHRVVAELYDSIKSHKTWMSYLQDSSNSSGIFHEESPEDPNSPQATFRTFNGIHWTGGLTHYWNLEHEFAHYLDGRYLKKGTYSTAVNHMISWWSEGLAQHFGFWNGPERQFTTAHSAFYPKNILSCDTALAPYNENTSNKSIKDFTIVNESKQTVFLKRVNYNGSVSKNKKAIELQPNESWNGFNKGSWHQDDRFIIRNEDKSCLGAASLSEKSVLAFENNQLIAKHNTASLYEVFHKEVNPYSWGHLAFTFLFEEKLDDLKQFVNLTKQGKYTESDAFLEHLAQRYEADFQAWLYWGTKKAFLDSFELPESDLPLNSYTTLYGAGDWGFKLHIEKDLDELTIGSAGGVGEYDLLIGKGKPVHSIGSLNQEALVCKTNIPVEEQPKQACTLTNVTAGDYYITIDNVSAIAVLADTHIYACEGENCINSVNLPKDPEPETVAVLEPPRIIESAAIDSCVQKQPYELTQNDKNQLHSFKITNHAKENINLQRIDATTGNASSTSIQLSPNDSWQPKDTIYNSERVLVSNAQGQCLGTITAKKYRHIGFYDRTPISDDTCKLKESYTSTGITAKNASLRNESNQHIYAFWVFPEQAANQKTNGLLRRSYYASLAPGETWDNITWRHDDRIMLGNSDDPKTAKCLAILEVDSDKHSAFTLNK